MVLESSNRIMEAVFDHFECWVCRALDVTLGRFSSLVEVN